MAQRSRIFISYSHKDRDRADFLWRELRARGHAVYIDREGILEAELITNRIRDMIQGADVVLLVLGPNWISSPACRMEMGFALEQNKRILPAAFEDVGADLPPEIKEINYVRFYGEDGAWDRAVERLDGALDRDIDWIRLHTRFGEAAARYLAGEGAAPRGRELRLMRRWIERHPRGAPNPTADHWRYFKAGMARRKWVQIGSAMALTLVVTLGGLGGIRALATAQCDELRAQAQATEGLDPVLAIESILPLADNTWCRTSGAWLEVLQTLGDTIREQRLRATVTLPDPSAHFVDFLPGTGQVLTVTSDGDGTVFDPLTGAEIEDALAVPERGDALRTTFDGGRFLLLQDRQVTVWDPGTGQLTGLAFGAGASVTHAVLSPGGTTLVVATGDHRLHFHSLASGRAVHESMDLGAPVQGLSFVPASARLIAAVHDELRVIDLVPATNGRSPGQRRTLAMPGEIAAMSLSADGSTVAAATGNVVGVWDLTTFEPIFAPDEYYFGPIDILSLGLSPDGLRLAVGASDTASGIQYARIHDVPTGKSVITLEGHDSPVSTVRFSPDGHSVMTRDRAGVMRLYDVFTGHPVPSISGEMTEAVISTSQAMVRFDSGGGRTQLLATGTEITLDRNAPRILRLTHVAPDAHPFYNDLLSHEGLVTSMALSPDERLLVTGADDGQVYVWDAQTGLLLYTFGHALQGLVTFVAADFTPSGEYIVSWDNSGERRIWAIQPLSGDLFQTACRLLPFQNGVRDVAGLTEGEGPLEGDPCDNMLVLPRLSATMWLTGGN